MPDVSFALLTGTLVALAVASFMLAPRARTAEGFFFGTSPAGVAPGVWTLTFSQVTTWIFARSLLNAAILGYFFGIAGALAYTAYYLSFLTGAWIVDRLRFERGARNIQGFLHQRFGRIGTGSFNLLVGVRLVSEVFANLLVVGIVFGATGSLAYTVAILAVAGVTLGYSMLGGLHASLRTDVLQFGILTALLIVLFAMMLLVPEFAPGAILASSPELVSPGWILLLVALIQVPSYPLHDPVMMDRGFLADRATTRRSFVHAFWISALLILAFGLLGVFTGLHRSGTEEFLDTLTRLLGQPAALLLGIALVVSAASTMDSTFASTAKLTVIDMNLGRRSSTHGRVAMALFAAAGLLMVFFGTQDLFAAVAVSGTAALFLTPVIVWSIAFDREVAPAALVAAVAASLTGAVLYFLESSGHVAWIEALTGIGHDYSKLLLLNLVALTVGLTAFALGDRGPARRPV
ncbi:Pantothenate:Na+ symporter / Sodium-dependent multivitamin transporter [Thioalkalivibrio nitratireducens DSM 14787]|uniref:Pantothenate:Na+ symporter / Sodium-dependent multivitamin transporter n=2 Tax=Thioalkalivibrio nitratireducens TaxID=186931 RepID=L0DUI3_THIND|nr:Pantothenate:Na+ symporter / Sodium-dependent multivitamin transporter [Thioalkalivibrio nitratireducens DSM 14787]